MPTLEEAIEIFEQLSKLCETNGIHDSQELYKQYAAYLRELQERRKESKIITCGECKHYKIDHPRANGYHCCYRCHNIYPMKETDFCSRAERRTDD